MQVFFFILGTIFGSFFGVIIDRLPEKRSIAYGRSECDQCHTVLKPLDLVPVFSYLVNKGRCRHCGMKLSSRYLYLELLTGFLFLLVFHQVSFSYDLLLALTFTSLLIVIAFIDLDTMYIYDGFQYIIFGLALVNIFLHPGDFKSKIIGAIIVFIPYLLLAIATKGIGGGDVKLSFTAGFFLGFPNILVGFILAVLLGGVHGIYLLKIKKLELKTAIPFGPYLCIGFFVAMLYGPSIITWYLQFLL